MYRKDLISFVEFEKIEAFNMEKLVMKKIVSVLMVCSSVFFLGCSEENEDSTVTTKYDGSWGVTCTDFGGGLYATMTLTVSGGEFSFSQTVFTDSTCTTPNATHSLGQSGDFTIGSAVTTTAGEADQLDLTLATNTATPLTTAVAATFNGSSTCTFTDWAVDVAKNIGGQTCLGESPQDSVGSTDYDLVFIDTTNTPNRLHFGDSATGDGETAETRTTEIDTSFYFSKQ